MKRLLFLLLLIFAYSVSAVAQQRSFAGPVPPADELSPTKPLTITQSSGTAIRWFGGLVANRNTNCLGVGPADIYVGTDTQLVYVCKSDGTWGAGIAFNAGGGGGTVTSVSVVTANGFSGSVANATTTPAITINNPTALVVSTSVAIGGGSAITSSGAGGALGSNAFNSTAYMPLTGGTFTGDVTHSGAAIIISGNISVPTWTTNGVRIKGTPGTLTDTTAATGTTATAYTDVLGGNTIAATNTGVIYTNYFALYAKDSVAGTNVTLTNKWAIGGDSAKFGTSNQVTISNAGVLTATSPVFTTPTLGVASATTINKVTITAPATGSTLTIPDGVTLNAGAGGTLGSAAFQNTGTSGANLPFLNGNNTYSGTSAYSSTIIQTSASATSFVSGPNGATNPLWVLNNSTASQVDGTTVSAGAAGTGTTFTATSSGSNAGWTYIPKGTGGILISSAGVNTVSLLGLNFQSVANPMGFYAAASTELNLGINGTDEFSWGPGRAVLKAASLLSWSTTSNLSSTGDTVLGRRTTATVNLGAGDVDTGPVAQALTVQSALAGGTANTAGAAFKIVGSLGKSTGVPGAISLQGGALITASGTVQQTAIPRLDVGLTKVLTNSSPITIANCTVASNTVAGGVLRYMIEVFDGTNLQSEQGIVAFNVANKAGVFSGNTIVKSGNQQFLGSGTLTVTFAISAANPGALSVNAASSLTPSTGYPRIVFSVDNGSQNTITYP